MYGRVAGKVAFITGAARGQGRAHALRLAQEGASIVATDACAPIDTVGYPLPSEADLAETVAIVQEAGGTIVSAVADVRSQSELDAVVKEALAAFGTIDIVVANAGITSELNNSWELSEVAWQTVLDINLTGVWHTVKAVAPAIIETGRGGSIVLTSSSAGAKGFPHVSAYVAAKHGVIGLMKSLANELAPHMVRVNAVLPTTVETPMILNEVTYGLFCPDIATPTIDDAKIGFASLNLLPIPWVEAIDISNAVLWLASDEARYVTGVALSIDAGALTK